MAREFSRNFYRSKEWQNTREFVLMRDRFLCVKCGKPAEEVHHIIHLSPDNIWNPEITMDPQNLVSLCKDCHFAEHYEDKGKGQRKNKNTLGTIYEYDFDADGNIVERT